MTSDALRYLKQYPVYWINMRKSEERRKQWFDNISGLFKSETRVEAVDGSTLHPHVIDDFVEAWWNIYDTRRDELNWMVNRPPGRKFRRTVQQGNVGCRLSHLKALQMGIEAGHERFFVAEDDIVPRSALFRESVPAPPLSAQLAIWSGGLPLASHVEDSRVYETGRALAWVKPADPFNSLCTGLYEVDHAAAAELHLAVSGIQMSYDHAWGFALRELEVVRSKPNAFVQKGASHIRTKKTREPIVERWSGR